MITFHQKDTINITIHTMNTMVLIEIDLIVKEEFTKKAQFKITMATLKLIMSTKNLFTIEVLIEFTMKELKDYLLLLMIVNTIIHLMV